MQQVRYELTFPPNDIIFCNNKMVDSIDPLIVVRYNTASPSGKTGCSCMGMYVLSHAVAMLPQYCKVVWN